MDPIDAYLKLVQGKRTLVVKQNVQLKFLASTVRDVVGISVVSGVDIIFLADFGDILAKQVHDSKIFMVRVAGVVDFIENSSIRSTDKRNYLNPELRNIVLQTVAESLLATYIKLIQLEAEPGSINVPTKHRLPPVFSLEHKGLRPRAFCDVLELHRDRLF